MKTVKELNAERYMAAREVADLLVELRLNGKDFAKSWKLNGKVAAYYAACQRFNAAVGEGLQAVANAGEVQG